MSTQGSLGMLWADDAGIVSKSAEDLAKMTAIVTVFEASDLTVSEKKTETCLLYTSPSPRDGLLSRMPSSA